MAISDDHKEEASPPHLRRVAMDSKGRVLHQRHHESHLGGGRAKGGFSARQNYYATLNSAPKPSGRKPHDPDAMDVDAMHTSKLSKDEQDKLREERKCFNCKKRGHLVRDCQKKDPEHSG